MDTIVCTKSTVFIKKGLTTSRTGLCVCTEGATFAIKHSNVHIKKSRAVRGRVGYFERL